MREGSLILKKDPRTAQKAVMYEKLVDGEWVGVPATWNWHGIGPELLRKLEFREAGRTFWKLATNAFSALENDDDMFS